MFDIRSTTMYTPAQYSLENEIPEPEVFEPKKDQCNYCLAPLEFYKTTELRTVWTLTGPRRFKEKQLRCSNDKCKTRAEKGNANPEFPTIVKNPEINMIVWPGMQYGIDVILEIGRLYVQNHWNGTKIQQELAEKFQLDISLATVYRFVSLYEALNKAIQIEHREEVADRLQSQLVFILIVDATQYQGKTLLYRAIDYLSGYCFGTLLIPESGKKEIKNWLESIIDTYGTPDYIVSDAEPNLHQPLVNAKEVPHGDCWWHVLHNVYMELVNSWHGKTQRLLQKHQYRRRLLQIRKQLLGQTQTSENLHGQAVKAILDLFLAKESKRKDFINPLGDLLERFKEGMTLLNKWDRLLKVQLPCEGEIPPQLQELRDLKGEFSREERRNWYVQPFFQGDPFFQAFREIHTLFKAITQDKQFRSLRKEYQAINKEIFLLRTWLDETQLQQWEELLRQEVAGQVQLPAHVKKRVVQNIMRNRKWLTSLYKSHRTWHRIKVKSDLPFDQKARLLLNGLIDRWKTYGKKKPSYNRAVKIIERQYHNLLVFLEHPLIPATNQAIETDHSLLKQIWRQSSGCQDKPYTLDYHGDGLSATRNCHTRLNKESPLEKLGFHQSQIIQWYYQCPYSLIQVVKDSYETIRESRRQRLRIRRQGLAHILAWTSDAWLDWLLSEINLYLAS